MQKPFQRIGATSNSQVGREFEHIAMSFFAKNNLILQPNHKVEVGIGSRKKLHAFDLGCPIQKVIVECKSHRWTSGQNVPSAKMTVWNEAMYYFHAAPAEYRKIMFVLHHLNSARAESLLEYYIKTNNHLIPNNVEFWEYNEETGMASCVFI